MASQPCITTRIDLPSLGFEAVYFLLFVRPFGSKFYGPTFSIRLQLLARICKFCCSTPLHGWCVNDYPACRSLRRKMAENYSVFAEQGQEHSALRQPTLFLLDQAVLGGPILILDQT